MRKRTHIYNREIVFWTAQHLEASQLPLSRRGDEDGIWTNVAMGGGSGIIEKSKSDLVQKISKALKWTGRAILTEIRCSPQISQSSRSRGTLEDDWDSARGSGRTLSVMMQMVESDSTTSMNLRTSGCRMVRSLRRELRARGMVDLLRGCVRSYSKTETRLPSSCSLAD
jgi:hypothetical protein